MPKKPPPPSYLADLHTFDYDAFFARCWRGDANEDDEQQYPLRLASYFVACGELGKPVPEWVLREVRSRLWGWIAGAPIAEQFYLPGTMPKDEVRKSVRISRAVGELLHANPDMKVGEALDEVAAKFHVERVTVEKAYYAPKPWKSHTFKAPKV